MANQNTPNAEDVQPFSLSDASAGLTEALEESGYDIASDPNEPNLLQARRDSATGVANIMVDSGGQLRFTLTRSTGPQKAEMRKADKWSFAITRESSETLTVSYQLTQADGVAFAHFLKELEKI